MTTHSSEIQSTRVTKSLFDPEVIRREFPILKMSVSGKPLVYLDNAATAQKPQSVIDAVSNYYTEENSNIHRGVHYLSDIATRKYEGVRTKVQKLLNARHDHEIIFVRGTTEGINLVAQSFGKLSIVSGDEIIISEMEHHSNIIPWQMLCEEREARLIVLPITDRGEIELDVFRKLPNKRTKLVALTHVSNVLGTLNPIKEAIAIAHSENIPVLIDGAQAIAHLKVDVQELDCDFYVFSSHKMYGPTGVGVLYGKEKWLEKMPPYQGGGDMIKSVTFEKTIFNDLPHKFEAGTPNIAGTVGFGAAVEYLQHHLTPLLENYEDDLLRYAHDTLKSIKGLNVIGTAEKKISVVSFILDGIHPHDIGTILNYDGIAVRTGHHCAQPVMDRYQIPATVRASLAMYNTHKEIDILAAGIEKVMRVFS